MLFKKLSIIAGVSAMFLSSGALVEQSIQKPQIVQASTNYTKDAYKQLLARGLAAPLPDLNAKPKIHLYKRAKVTKTWKNLGLDCDNYSNMATGSMNLGADIVAGTLKLKSRKYYITINDGGQYTPSFMDMSTSFETPKLMHSNHPVRWYDIGSDNDRKEPLNVWDDTLDKTSPMQYKIKHYNFLIPTHHNSIKLPDFDAGTMRTVVPVFFINKIEAHPVGYQLASGFITKKEFDKLQNGLYKNKAVPLTGYGKLYSKNGKPYTTWRHNKYFKRDYLNSTNKFLKTMKGRAQLIKGVKEQIKEAKNSKYQTDHRL